MVFITMVYPTDWWDIPSSGLWLTQLRFLGPHIQVQQHFSMQTETREGLIECLVYLPIQSYTT